MLGPRNPPRTSKYIVLRDPWRNTETMGSLGGIWTLHDESFWRDQNLPDIDGAFTVDAKTFKDYSVGIGVDN